MKMVCLPDAMVGSWMGKSLYLKNMFQGWLEKSKCELYVSNILRLNCLMVTVVMWVETSSLNVGTIDVFSQIVLCGGQGCCPVHFRMFSRIPGLYSPDSSNTLSTLDNRNCLQTLWNFSWERRRGEGKIALGWETSCPWHEGETVLFLRRKGLKYWVGQKVHLVFHKVLWKNLNEFLANPVLRAEFHFSSLSLNGLTRQMYGTEKVWQILTG